MGGKVDGQAGCVGVQVLHTPAARSLQLAGEVRRACPGRSV